MCRPSSLLHRSLTRGCSRPMLPHVIEEITHMSLSYFSLTPPLAPSQSFSQAPALLTSSLNLSLHNHLQCSTSFSSLFFSLLPLVCFSVMSRPTAECHWIDWEKKWEDWGEGRAWQAHVRQESERERGREGGRATDIKPADVSCVKCSILVKTCSAVTTPPSAIKLHSLVFVALLMVFH